MSEEKKTTIKTKHGELSLEQLAEVQPGLARLMKEVGERYHILYYAGKGGNWQLAQHELNSVMSLFRAASTLRPKYAEDLDTFNRDYFAPIAEAIKTKDWKSFETSYNRSVEGSNVYHEKRGYDYIRFVLPKNPPEFYDLKYQGKTGEKSH